MPVTWHAEAIALVGAHSGTRHVAHQVGFTNENASVPPARPDGSGPAGPGLRRTGATAVTPLRAPQSADPAQLNIDPGGLALASLAAAAAFLATSRPWDSLSSGVGVCLLVISLANHRAWTGTMTVHGLLQRLTFAGTAVLPTCIAIAWPVQLQMDSADVWLLMADLDTRYSTAFAGVTEWAPATTEFLAFLWPVIAATLLQREPRLFWLLEVHIPSRQRIRRRRV